MIILSIILVLSGLLMIVKPDLVWMISESWKSTNAEGPSDLYVLSVRIGGCLCALAGLVGVVTFFWLGKA